MTLLLLSVLMGYALRNGSRQLVWFRSDQTQPPQFYFDLIILLLSVALACSWYLFGSEADDHSKKLVQVLAGGIIGWIASYCILSGTLSLSYIAVAGVLLVIGAGSHYWKSVLNDLEIIEIGGIKRSTDLDGPGALHPLYVDLAAIPDNPNTPSHEFDQIARLLSSVEWDFRYMNSLTDSNISSDSDKEIILRVLAATLTPIASCGQQVDKVLNRDGRVPDILRPVAANFSELLNNPAAAKDLVPRLVSNLDDSMERLSGLFLLAPQGACQLPDVRDLDLEDWKSFVAQSELYPYGTIALAYLLVRIGNQGMAVNILQGWIKHFRTNLMRESPLGVAQVSLVRAHHVLEIIAGSSEANELAEIRLAYIASLEELLSVAKFRRLVSYTSDCGKYSDDESTSYLILAQMSEKNEFAYWIGKNDGVLYRSEAVMYSEEVGRYQVEECLADILPTPNQHDLAAAFLDTFAYVKLKFGIHDNNMCVISKEEFGQLTKDAVSAWETVLGKLGKIEELTPEPWIRRIIEHRLAIAKKMVGQNCRN